MAHLYATGNFDWPTEEHPYCIRKLQEELKSQQESSSQAAAVKENVSSQQQSSEKTESGSKNERTK